MQQRTVAGRGDEAEPAVKDAAPAATRGHVAHPSDPPITVIRQSQGLFDLGLPSLWAYRELLYFLVWRDVKVRYKQTVVGLLWVVLQPLATMLIFTFVFSRTLKVSTGDIPYPLFAYAGLLPWGLFSAGITGATSSIVTNGSLISKVYFPRLIIPVASVLAGLVDLVVSLFVLAALMWYYHF
ncbi:MAG TPA: hypothetical protein VHD91_00180, partial [Gaiellaceae bacterium]|nr:hypothetical protein [Gaiellaceae bacterium]